MLVFYTSHTRIFYIFFYRSKDTQDSWYNSCDWKIGEILHFERRKRSRFEEGNTSLYGSCKWGKLFCIDLFQCKATFWKFSFSVTNALPTLLFVFFITLIRRDDTAFFGRAKINVQVTVTMPHNEDCERKFLLVCKAGLPVWWKD